MSSLFVGMSGRSWRCHITKMLYTPEQVVDVTETS
jgi:hypothetical protein